MQATCSPHKRTAPASTHAALHVRKFSTTQASPQTLCPPPHRYYRCLTSLSARFPLLDGVGTSVPLFKWRDAFHASRVTAHHSLLLERACVLFNLAVTISQQAQACHRGGAEGSSQAALLFQVRTGPAAAPALLRYQCAGSACPRLGRRVPGKSPCALPVCSWMPSGGCWRV